MNLNRTALDLLKETSRTFYIPISRLPSGLQEAVASAYLCMRAIDQIEDHPTLDNAVKARMLRQISLVLQAGDRGFTAEDFRPIFEPQLLHLEEVTLRLDEWLSYAPSEIAPRIWEAISTMSDRMAHWADCNWAIETEAELNQYTFSVAASVGLLLSDLWAWYDGTKTDRVQAVGFGRGLQSVNILRNHGEDYTRGVTFYPKGWTNDQMQAYSRRQLELADAYVASLPETSPALDFCRIILMLAHATLDAMEQGAEKLTRSEVMQLVQEVTKAS